MAEKDIMTIVNGIINSEVPPSSSDEYYKIRDMILSHNDIEELLSLCDDIIQKILHDDKEHKYNHNLLEDAWDSLALC